MSLGPLAFHWLTLAGRHLSQGAPGRQDRQLAAIIAVAANTDGRREIIGLGLGPSEAEALWLDLPRGLKAHGLEGTKLVISFGGKTVPRTVFPPALPDSGLGAATERVFETPRQRCRVHRMRSAPAHVSRGRHTAVAPAIRQAFD